MARLGCPDRHDQEQHEERRRRRVQQAGDQHRAQRQPRPAAEVRRDRPDPHREDENARMEIAFERVDAGLRDAMTQRFGGDERPRRQ
jgi:hypothetical protein